MSTGETYCPEPGRPSAGGDNAARDPATVSLSFASRAEFREKGCCRLTTEYLLVDAVASWFATTFRTTATQAKLEVLKLEVEGEGLLKARDGGCQLTQIVLRPRLEIEKESDRQRALRLLEDTRRSCPIADCTHIRISLDPLLTVSNLAPARTPGDRRIPQP